MIFYSLTGISFPIGDCYEGDERDMVIGDRKATAAEITAYEAKKLEAMKPKIVTKLQMQTAMKDLLLWNDFKAMRLANADLEDYWSDALEVYRYDPIVLSMGRTDAELDALFALASTK